MPFKVDPPHWTNPEFILGQCPQPRKPLEFGDVAAHQAHLTAGMINPNVTGHDRAMIDLKILRKKTGEGINTYFHWINPDWIHMIGRNTNTSLLLVNTQCHKPWIEDCDTLVYRIPPTSGMMSDPVMASGWLGCFFFGMVSFSMAPWKFNPPIRGENMAGRKTSWQPLSSMIFPAVKRLVWHIPAWWHRRVN